MKLLAYPLSLVYAFLFLLTLLIFHPIQWVTHNIIGYNAHKKTVVYLQFWLMRCLNILGTRFTFINPHNIPTDQPLIIVANHQSMYDIPPLLYYMGKYHPKFVSKIELGKGIPSVSYNLRHGGSVLIDRKQPLKSIKEIKDFAQKISNNNWSAIIFPEGTRSKTGHPKPFKTKGLQTLITHMPNALVVPITINNSWKILRYGKFPLGLGVHILFKVHKPLTTDQLNTPQLIKKVEQIIINDIQHESK